MIGLGDFSMHARKNNDKSIELNGKKYALCKNGFIKGKSDATENNICNTIEQEERK